MNSKLFQFFFIFLGKYTLIFEIVDILVKIIDVSVDDFFLQDVGIQEISSKDLTTGQQ